MHSDGNNFGGDVVFGSFNMEFTEEERILGRF